MQRKQALDWTLKSTKRASVGESILAWSTENGVLERRIETFQG
jgi:hypothetical protein